MARVIFTYKNGRERSMSEFDAKLLQRLGHGSYSTADMSSKTIIKPIVAETAKVEIKELDDDFDAKTVDELREIAKDLGIEVHHRAGAEKIREAIRGK